MTPQQQCRVTAYHLAHQRMLIGNGNKDHVPQREIKPKQDATESMLTSPFRMEDLLKGIKAIKAVGKDNMLCDQIKNFSLGTTND